jgi:hypothetical protein
MATVRLLGSDGSTWELLVPGLDHAESQAHAEQQMHSNGKKSITWEIVEVVPDSDFPVSPEDYVSENKDRHDAIVNLGSKKTSKK